MFYESINDSLYLRRAGFARVARVLTIIALVCIGAASAQSSPTAQSVEGLPLGPEYPYRSPLALVASEQPGVVYLVNHTAASVEAVKLDSGEVASAIKLASAPSGLALDTERNRLYVARGNADGAIDVVDTKSFEVVATFAAGHTPIAPAISPDGKSLYVCSRFDNEVAVYDAKTGERRASVTVAREPIASALTPDGSILLVAQHLPAQAANDKAPAVQVNLIAVEEFEKLASIALPSGSTSLRDICISPDGRYAYATHNIGRFGVPTTQLERGWMNTSALSIVDIAAREWLTTILLDDVDRGAANPWGIVCTPDGASLVVAHSGTHELSLIDRTALHATLESVAAGESKTSFARSLAEVPNDLGFVTRLRRRLPLPGNGPRGLVALDDELVVAEYFTDSLARIKLAAGDKFAIEQVVLGTPPAPDAVRRGEIAFHDAALCFQEWQSCASCHPDVRTDALNWDLLNDGIGNPKNTRTLLYSHRTPPVMITGIRPRAEVAVRAGFRFIQFAQVTEEVSADVDVYLSALNAIPSPHLENGRLSAAAERGRAVFERGGCISCHSGDYYTDGKKHDVGTGPDERGIKEFVTPPLKEVWRTAPYLFYGQAADMKEVFTKYNPKDLHGRTSGLSEPEMDDLVEYILSL